MAHLNLQAIVVGGCLGLRILVSSVTTTVLESVNYNSLSKSGRSGVETECYARNLHLEKPTAVADSKTLDSARTEDRCISNEKTLRLQPSLLA